MTLNKQRFGGINRLYGSDAFGLLKNAHVCVIGIGGVGSWSAEALARSGVGQLTLIDMDDICVTNTNRQVHTQQDTVGQMKVEAMAARIRAISPDCAVHPVADFVTRSNVLEHLNKGYDYVIEATDSIQAKAAIIAWCKHNKVKVITVGGAGGQIDPTQIGITDISKTTQDPLASKLRSYLRRHHNFSSNPKRRFGVECVYSTEQLRYPQPDGSVCQSKYFADGSVKLDCSGGFGAAVMVTGSFGFVAAARVVEKLLERARRQQAGD